MNAERLMFGLLQCSDQDSVTWPLTGLEEDWTMTLIDGSGTANGSAVVHEKHWLLAVPLLRLPLFLGHTEHTTLFVKKVGQSPLQACLSVQSTGSLTWKSLREVPENGKLCEARLVSMLHAELCGSLEASALCECLRGSQC